MKKCQLSIANISSVFFLPTRLPFLPQSILHFDGCSCFQVSVAFGLLLANFKLSPANSPFSPHQTYCVHYPAFPALLSSSQAQWCVFPDPHCAAAAQPGQDSLGVCSLLVSLTSQGRDEGSRNLGRSPVHTAEKNNGKSSVVARRQTSESWNRVRQHAAFL